MRRWQYVRYRSTKPHLDFHDEPAVVDTRLINCWLCDPDEFLAESVIPEMLHYRATTCPPYQHLCIGAAIYEGVLKLIDASIITEVKREPELDPRLWQFLLQQLESAPLFSVISNEDQRLLREVLAGLPSRYEQEIRNLPIGSHEDPYEQWQDE